MAAQIQFLRGVKPESLAGLDSNAIYFFTDTQEIYMGGKIYGVNPATISALDSAIEALEAVDLTHDNKLKALEEWMATAKGEISTIQGDYLKNADKTALEGKIATAQGAAEAAQNAADAAQDAADAAQDAADAAQGEVDTLEGVVEALAGKVGEVPENQTVMGIITNIQENAYDDTAVRGLITANANAIAAETKNREDADTALDERLDAVEAFFELAEGEKLDAALDTLKEIQDFINGEASAADQMVKDIAENASNISKEVNAREQAVKNLDAADEALDERLKAVEAELAGEGEGTVADQIAAAVAGEATLRQNADNALGERIDGVEGDLADAVEELEGAIADAQEAAEAAAAADATTKANAAEKNAKDYADGLAGNYATAAQGAKADTAVQEITTGTANGTIAVDGEDVAVKGLGTAAYQNVDAFDAKGAASDALDAAKNYTDTCLTWGVI